MSLDSDIALLRRVPLFVDLPTEPIRLLAFSAGRRELAPDQILFREGDPANSGFVVTAGGIQITTGGEKAKRKVLATCEAGSLVGELALLIETKRPGTAIAMTASELLEIDRTLILRMLNEFPRVAVDWRATMSERLIATVGELGRIRNTLQDMDKRRARR
jgi:CRP-like cAMP-binding protein